MHLAKRLIIPRFIMIRRVAMRRPAIALSVAIVTLVGMYANVAARVAMAQPVEQLPSSRDGNWVVDEARAVPPYAVEQLQKLCETISGFKRSEMVLLIVRKTGRADPRSYGVDYFNRERIGDAVNNNGVLILCSLEDRAIEIIFGDGLDNAENNRAAKRIMDELIIPKMKRNDIAGALFGGAFGTARDVLGYAELAKDIPRSRMETSGARPRQLRVDNRNRIMTPLYWTLFGGGAAFLFGIALIVARYRVRYGRRNCEVCATSMLMLDEQRDDAHLDPPEIVEEELGSVDYDVWACPQCDHVLKYRYGRFLTRYSRCPRCRYKTRSKVSRALRAATTRRGGLIRVDETCANCTYKNTYTYTTPRLPKKSSGGGGGWSSGGWSGSSSGGGWSGGGGGGGFSGGSSGGFSSGGGGASGRW